VRRHPGRHDVRDLTIAIRFEGAYDAAYIDGDNRDVLPTDTMKNTVYAFAAREPVEEPESFGEALARHFLARNPRLQRVRIDLTEHLWSRIARGDREHGDAFLRHGPETRTAAVEGDRRGLLASGGVADLLVLKSARSAFTGFLRDEYTTLADTRDRLFVTSLTATWQYREGVVEFAARWRAIRGLLLEVFAEHRSESVQHTLHAMGQAVLDGVDDVAEIRLVMPNRHHLPVDVSRFGLENRNEVFVPTDEPHGLIEATLAR